MRFWLPASAAGATGPPGPSPRRIMVRQKDITGLKLLLDPRTYFEGEGARTPYGAKLIARRRAANKAAKLARRRNR